MILDFHLRSSVVKKSESDSIGRDTTATPAMRKKGDIELLELIAKDPQAFILKQGWASVSLNGDHGLKELRSLYAHLQARILEMIETLDDQVGRPRRWPHVKGGRKLDGKGCRKGPHLGCPFAFLWHALPAVTRYLSENDETVIGQIVSAQREELEQEIASLENEADRVAEEARELAGEVPF